MTKVKFFLFLLILIFFLFIHSITLASYDIEKAVEYANEWCNKPNPEYCKDYWEINRDCANFVSQCLIAGGLDLSDGPGTDAYGAIPLCSNLHKNLIKFQNVRYEKRYWNEKEPDWLEPGDIAIWSNPNQWEHAVFIIAKNEYDNFIYAAHSNPRCEGDGQLVLYGSSYTDFCYYYKILDGIIKYYTWDFNQRGYFENWQICNDGKCYPSDSDFDLTKIAVQSETGWEGIGQVYLIIDPGEDPQLISPEFSIDASEYNAVEFSMKNECLANTNDNLLGNVFFKNESMSEFDQNHRVDFTVINDDQFHTYIVSLNTT